MLSAGKNYLAVADTGAVTRHIRTVVCFIERRVARLDKSLEDLAEGSETFEDRH